MARRSCALARPATALHAARALALLAALALPPARATAVYVSAAKACPFRPWSTDSDGLRALATAWSHTHDVRNWRFAAEDANCSRAEYDTSVNVPGALAMYWKQDSLRMAIAKRVCSHGLTMRETATIRNIPVLDSLEIKVFAAAEPETGTVSLSAEFALAVPWYLKVLDAPVQEQVRNSVREYLELLAGDACAAPGRRALRRAPRARGAAAA